MREREREKEKSACTRERESQRKLFGSSFYMLFPPPGPALCKLGLARSAVCSAWSFHSGPRTFLWPCLLATTILDSFSLFYLPNTTISSSVVPFSSCPQSFPASGSFPMSQLFASSGQSTGVSASISVLPMNTQDWSPLGWTGWISLQSRGLSRVFSNTTVQKYQFFGTHLLNKN